MILAAIHTAHAVSLIGWLIVIGCIIAAGVAAWQQRWVPALVLLVVAIVAAALFFGA